jgi:hypothetical protein
LNLPVPYTGDIVQDADAKMVEAWAGFNDEWQYFRVEPVGPGVVREAEFMIQGDGKTLGLRTLDAIHLATFKLPGLLDFP